MWVVRELEAISGSVNNLAEINLDEEDVTLVSCWLYNAHVEEESIRWVSEYH